MTDAWKHAKNVHLGCEHRKPRRGEGAPPFPAPKGWTARVEVIDAQHEEDGGPCGMAQPQSEGVRNGFCFRLMDLKFQWMDGIMDSDSLDVDGSTIFLIQWNFFVWTYNFGYYSRLWWDNITKMGETHTQTFDIIMCAKEKTYHTSQFSGDTGPDIFFVISWQTFDIWYQFVVHFFINAVEWKFLHYYI